MQPLNYYTAICPCGATWFKVAPCGATWPADLTTADRSANNSKQNQLVRSVEQRKQNTVLRQHQQSLDEVVRYSCNQCEYQATRQAHIKIHQQPKLEGVNSVNFRQVGRTTRRHTNIFYIQLKNICVPTVTIISINVTFISLETSTGYCQAQSQLKFWLD